MSSQNSKLTYRLLILSNLILAIIFSIFLILSFGIRSSNELLFDELSEKFITSKLYVHNFPTGFQYAEVQAPNVGDEKIGHMVKLPKDPYLSCDTDRTDKVYVILEGAKYCVGKPITGIKSGSADKYNLQTGVIIVSEPFTNRNGWNEGTGLIFTNEGLIIEKYYDRK